MKFTNILFSFFLTVGSLLTAQSTPVSELNITYVSPKSGSTFGGTITVVAEISDPNAITSADLYVGSTLVGAMTATASGDYIASLDTAAFVNGWHNLKIIAIDSENNTFQSLLTVQFENGSSSPITITFDSPESGASIYGTVTVAATITDSIASNKITSAELYVDSTLVGAMTLTASSGYVENIDTTQFSNGSHQLEIIATDSDNNTNQSLLMVQIENTASS